MRRANGDRISRAPRAARVRPALRIAALAATLLCMRTSSLANLPATCGDVDASGEVTASDALNVLRYAVGGEVTLLCAHVGCASVAAASALVPAVEPSAGVPLAEEPFEFTQPSMVASRASQKAFIAVEGTMHVLDLETFTLGASFELDSGLEALDDVSDDGTTVLAHWFDHAARIDVATGGQTPVGALPAGLGYAGGAFGTQTTYVAVGGDFVIRSFTDEFALRTSIFPYAPDERVGGAGLLVATPARTRILAADYANIALHVIDSSTDAVLGTALIAGAAVDVSPVNEDHALVVMDGLLQRIGLTDFSTYSLPNKMEILDGVTDAALTADGDTLVVVREAVTHCAIDEFNDEVRLSKPEVAAIRLSDDAVIAHAIVEDVAVDTFSTPRLIVAGDDDVVVLSPSGYVYRLSQLLSP